ncbi:MAG: hypothetical protein ACRC7I_08695 [Selenomonadaceae bacterium]
MTNEITNCDGFFGKSEAVAIVISFLHPANNFLVWLLLERGFRCPGMEEG